MTTTVYDKSASLVVCDSRWSIPGDFGFLYVDEAPFYKICIFNGNAFLFAGRAPVIDAWKRFFTLTEQGIAVQEPTLEGIAVLVAEMGSGRLIDAYQQDIVWPSQSNPMSVFAGTGSTHAANCWNVNRCARKAVETASGFDVCTGGPVRYVELSSGDRNWEDCKGIQSLDQAFMEKGMVMLNRADREKTILPFVEAAAIDPSVAELYNKAANGSLGTEVQAPCDALFNEAPEPEKQRFRETIRALVQSNT